MYICSEIVDNVCTNWQKLDDTNVLLQSIAITPNDAYALAGAIISLLIMAFLGGLIGRLLLNFKI